MEKKIFYGISAVLIFGLGISYILLKEWRSTENENSQRSEPLSGKEVALITIKERDESKPSQNTIVKISEPTVSLLSNKISAERANAYIQRFITDEYNRYSLAEAADNATTTEQQNIVGTFSLIPMVVLNTPKYITIRFMESSLQKHKQKADTSIQYIVFDMERGAPLSLPDLLKDSAASDTITKEFAGLITQNRNLTVEKIIQALKQKHSFGLSANGLALSINIEESDTGAITHEELTLPMEKISEILHDDVKKAIENEGENIRMSEPVSENTP